MTILSVHRLPITSLKKFSLVPVGQMFGILQPQMPVRALCRDPAPRGSLYEAFLNEVRLVKVLYGILLFVQRRGQRLYADRAAGELLYYGKKHPPVHLVESHRVYLKHGEGFFGHVEGYDPVVLNLRVIAHPLKYPVREPRRAAGAAPHFPFAPPPPHASPPNPPHHP